MASQTFCFAQSASSVLADSTGSQSSVLWTAGSSRPTNRSRSITNSRGGGLRDHVHISQLQLPRDFERSIQKLCAPASGDRKQNPHGRQWRFAAGSSENVELSPQSANSATDKKREYFLPTTLEESIDQARMAARQAISEGVKRLQLEVPLPLIGATDLDDWPGGIQQQFKAAGPVIKSLLKGLVDGEAAIGESGYRNYMIDESDAVAVWESEKAALVLFPTAGTVRNLEDLAKKTDRPLLIVNAQWQQGQVISDFGFGARRRAAEEFLKTFESVYLLKAMRIRGEDLRLLKRYPGDWQVFVVDPKGRDPDTCVHTVTERPTYKDLEQVLKTRKNAKPNQGWLGRMFSEFEFNRQSLNENQK